MVRYKSTIILFLLFIQIYLSIQASVIQPADILEVIIRRNRATECKTTNLEDESPRSGRNKPCIRGLSHIT